MKIEINRQIMLEAAKSVAKIAPANAPVDVLNGVLVEGSEDTGDVYMTATNYEVSIQHKVTASVGESGVILINARLLVDLLSKLEGEFVTLTADKPSLLEVIGGSCKLQINCHSPKSYPKPIMPFPEESILMSGICSLAKRTTFLVSKDDSKPALQCVQIKFQNNAVHAAATDGTKMMLVKESAEPTDEREFLLPGRALKILASVSKDSDVFEVGDIGKEIVFVRGDMMLSIRKLVTGNFMDTKAVIKNLKPIYSAVVDVDRMKEALGVVSIGAAAGDIRVPINMVLANGEIVMQCRNDYSEASIAVPASISQGTPDTGFFYDVSALLDLFKVVNGKVKLEIDVKGFILIKTHNEVYFQSPVKPPVKNEKPITQPVGSSQSEQGHEKQNKKPKCAKGAEDMKKDVA